MNEQIAGPDRRVVPPGTNAIARQLPFYETNYHTMKMSIVIDQFSYVEKLARLTQLYLELRLQQVIEKAQKRQPQVTVLRIQ